MKAFELIDIFGDAGIKAYGDTLEAVFVNTAAGMYSLITDPVYVEDVSKIKIEVEGSSLDSLFVSWLNELVFQFDAYGFIGKSIRIHSLHDNKISATVSGEAFDREKHSQGLLIKAATYHKLRIENIKGVWEAEVIFDI